MDFTDEDVVLILRLLDESPFDELRLETRDLKLYVSRNAGPGASPPGALPAQPSLAPGDRVGEADPPGSVAEAPEGGSPPDPATRRMPIVAPLLGVFYRAPKPGTPPFVDVGSPVENGTTVCIVEVMKLMHAIPAGTHGTIAEICATDGQLVEYGQTLFFVEPPAI